MGRTTRNRELLSALKIAEGTTQRNVLNNALDNTREYNNIKKLGEMAGQMGSATQADFKEDLAKFAIDKRPYLENVGNRGLTTYGQQALGLQILWYGDFQS